MKAAHNPDLSNFSGNQAPDPILAQAQAGVPALHALTAPMPNTKIAQKAYFVCTLQTACMHRGDGKKLPFINGVLATNIAEDISYLRREINEHQNPYVREADSEEVQEIEMLLNPRDTMKKAVRAEVEAELRSEIERSIRERINAEMVAGSTDAAKIAGIDAGSPVLRSTGEVQTVMLTPVSSTDIQNATAGGSKTQAAALAASAALAAARNLKK